MSFSKKTRDIVYKRTGGKCAYCGCDLKKGWNVDHVVPVKRDLDGNGTYEGEGTDDISNLLPSCPSCNIIKSSQCLESFRDEIENMYNSVERNGTFRVAERFGIVERKKKSIVFYYEKIGIRVLSLYKYYLSKEEKKLKQELENLDYYYKNIKTCIYDLDLAKQRINNCKKNIALYKNSINEITREEK